MSEATLYDAGAPTIEERIANLFLVADDLSSEPTDEESIATALIPALGTE